MDAWQAVILAVAALLVGALLPALVQLTLALRAVRATSARADVALVAITATAVRLDRMTASLEEGKRLDRFLEAIDALSRTTSRLLDGARLASAVGAAVAPAVGAAVRSWRASRPAGAAQGDGIEDTQREPKSEGAGHDG